MPTIHVKPGELWTAGEHVFYCGDLEAGGFDELRDMLISQPDTSKWVYSDPPWSAGNARYWRTCAGLPRRVDMNNFWNCFCNAIKDVRPRLVVVEQSVYNPESFMEAAMRHGLPRLAGRWTVYYGAPVTTDGRIVSAGHPNLLLAFSELDLPVWFNPSMLRGRAVTDYVFKNMLDAGLINSGDIVVDPCVGKGMTARMAHRYGQICYGLELNPKRLSATLEWFLKKGFDVERVHA